METVTSGDGRAVAWSDNLGRRQGPVDRRVSERGPGPQLAPRPVAIVGQTTVFHEALARALDAQPDIDVVVVGGSVNELPIVDRVRPVIVLIATPTSARIEPWSEALAAVGRLRLRCPHVLVIIMTDEVTPGLLAEAAGYGVSAFLPLDTPLTDLIEAVRTCGSGSIVVPASMLARLLARPDIEPERIQPQDRGQAVELGLTPRELEVLDLLGQGIGQKAIAARLGVSIHTCRGHVKRLLRKLDAHSQIEAVASASRLGLLSKSLRSGTGAQSDWATGPNIGDESYRPRALESRPPA